MFFLGNQEIRRGFVLSTDPLGHGHGFYVTCLWMFCFQVEDEPNKICEADRVAIKANIVHLMLSSPEQIQKQVRQGPAFQVVLFVELSSNYFFPLPQLSDAISIIGREDFPQKWPDLLTEMVNRFQSGDFHVINGVLRTAHSLFKRYWCVNSYFKNTCFQMFLLM